VPTTVIDGISKL